MQDPWGEAKNLIVRRDKTQFLSMMIVHKEIAMVLKEFEENKTLGPALLNSPGNNFIKEESAFYVQNTKLTHARTWGSNRAESNCHGHNHRKELDWGIWRGRKKSVGTVGSLATLLPNVAEMPPGVKNQILNGHQAHIVEEFISIPAGTVKSFLATVKNADSYFTTLDPPVHVDLNEGYCDQY